MIWPPMTSAEKWPTQCKHWIGLQNPENTVELDDYLLGKLNELPEAEVPKRCFFSHMGKIWEHHGESWWKTAIVVSLSLYIHNILHYEIYIDVEYIIYTTYIYSIELYILSDIYIYIYVYVIISYDIIFICRCMGRQPHMLPFALPLARRAGQCRRPARLLRCSAAMVWGWIKGLRNHV